jgi:peptidoglycan/LPS O-acetylase OafA/YrhL
MSPFSLVPILPIIALALVTISLISRAIPIRVPDGHYGRIDGMRGYLAFFVFLHHSSIWYLRLKYRYWGLPPSNLYSHFGPTSVAFFFMITAFLFFGKLLHAQSQGMDWTRLYIGRAFRILPLYWTVTVIVFLIVFILSGFRLFLSLGNVVTEMVEWLVFMNPDVNGLGSTGLIIAGITGSLAFEWLFYFTLPFIALLYPKLKAPTRVLVGAAILLLFFIYVINQYYPHLAVLRVLWFAGGIISALLIRNEHIRELAASKECSFFILVILGIAIYFFPSIDSEVPLICVIIVFIAIACGNTLFGILTSGISRKFGQISYSIFVLHGLLLFITFQFLIGPAKAIKISALEYWCIIAVIGVVVVCLSVLSYTYIELPMIKSAPEVSAKIDVGRKQRRLVTGRRSWRGD